MLHNDFDMNKTQIDKTYSVFN